jgi:hypothetical protein
MNTFPWPRGLPDHAWARPVDRAIDAAQCDDIRIVVTKIGQFVESQNPLSHWVVIEDGTIKNYEAVVPPQDRASEAVIRLLTQPF